MNPKGAEALLKKKVAELSEHFEGVQIMVAWQDGGNSHMMAEGAGNWYLRQGMARSWVETDTARSTAWEISKVTTPPNNA